MQSLKKADGEFVLRSPAPCANYKTKTHLKIHPEPRGSLQKKMTAMTIWPIIWVIFV